ncbi:MAG: ABC-F family ATP-binding cassette domain-containing protein [Lachnospiraceae bacterium]|nr:ABC-F family ATP-binding cassette domain-containing protein [Lachnospiraceae bacterium]
MILQISNGRVEFAGEVLFEHADFTIKNKRDKIAVVGRNGSGKTTLLKVISGEQPMTQHENDAPCVFAKTGNPSIGYLKQISFSDENLTLDEEIRKVFARIIRMQKRLEELVLQMEDAGQNVSMVDSGAGDTEGRSTKSHDALIEEYTNLQETFQDLGGYYYEKEYDTMLAKFGFDESDKHKKLSEFSGGQRTKLAFMKLLLSKPEVLLLDEPTNHLDVYAIEWLEGYLKSYPYALVVVSHDRMFLDRIVDTVYEIEHHTITRYTGNYSDYAKQKRERYEKQLKDYNAQQAEIKRLSDLAEKMKHHPTKVSMAHSKEKAIEHMDKIDAPDLADTRVFHSSMQPLHEPGKDILSVRNLTIGYAEEKPLCTVSFEVKRGERLGILGGNGLGKSTLLKTLTGSIDALAGEYHYGVNVEVGYFDQQMAQYASEKTVLDDFWDAYPKLMQQDVRSALGAFLFTQEDVFKTVNMLSGGEKVRLALAKIFQSRPNLLILDEPTNHMDMLSKEALEEMLRKYTGTVIFVSHDRYFISKIAGSVLEILPGDAKLYPFGYEDYLEKSGRAVMSTKTNADGNVGGKSAGSIAPAEPTKAQLSYQAGKELSRLKKKLEKIEADLAQVEDEIQKKKDELLDPAYASDYVHLKELQDQIDFDEEKILTLMEAYEETDEAIRELTT